MGPFFTKVVSNRIARAFNRSGATRAVALDISKAFDRVWHACLLQKLTSYGISGQYLALFLLFSVIDGFEWCSNLYCLICGNNLSWLLNLNLIYEILWTWVKSGFLISMLGKLIWFHLTGLITMALLMQKWMDLFLRKNCL